jgi:hypothetical protein
MINLSVQVSDDNSGIAEAEFNLRLGPSEATAQRFCRTQV